MNASEDCSSARFSSSCIIPLTSLFGIRSVSVGPAMRMQTVTYPRLPRHLLPCASLRPVISLIKRDQPETWNTISSILTLDSGNLPRQMPLDCTLCNQSMISPVDTLANRVLPSPFQLAQPCVHHPLWNQSP